MIAITTDNNGTPLSLTAHGTTYSIDALLGAAGEAERMTERWTCALLWLIAQHPPACASIAQGGACDCGLDQLRGGAS